MDDLDESWENYYFDVIWNCEHKSSLYMNPINSMEQLIYIFYI